MYTLHRQVGELQCLVLKAQIQQAVGLFGWWGGGQRSQKCRNVSQDTEFSHAGHSSSMGPNGDQKLGV